MADQSDVEAALVQAATAALYPQGTDAPSAVGAVCRVYRGWPNAAALDADLAAGRVNVSVFPVEGGARNTTRHAVEWLGAAPATPFGAAPAPALTVSVSGAAATFGGSAEAGQLAGLKLADGRSYVHRTRAGDTPALVAAMLAQAVRVNRIVVLAGSTVTVPGAAPLVARVAADAPMLQQVRRQEQAFRVTVWCPTPELRDTVASVLDAALASVRFLAFPDGSSGRLRWKGSVAVDKAQDAALYRRDLMYAVDYATTQGATQASMLFGLAGLNGFQTTI